MVLRQLLVLALVVLTLHASTEATSIAPSCPRTLETLLASAPCSPHTGPLLTAASTTIESTDAQDVCLDSLRSLIATSAWIPCVANVNYDPTSDHSQMRRLGAGEDLFMGTLKCTFDTAAPLNLSNPRQNFTLDCKEAFRSGSFTLVWIMIGVIGGPIVLWALYKFISRGVKNIKKWRDERAQRALDRIDDVPKSFFSRFSSHA